MEGPNRSIAVPIADQKTAVDTINSYFSAHSFPISYKLKPFPSNKDITETLKFLLTRLNYVPSNNLEEDLLKFPIEINESALKAPGTPHSFPSVLAVLHWFVQISMFNDHLANSIQTRSGSLENKFFDYVLKRYLHYMRGDDDAVRREGDDFIEKLNQESKVAEENVKAFSENMKVLEGKLDSFETVLSRKQVLKKERDMLESDVQKSHDRVEQLQAYKVILEKLVELQENVLEAKEEERQRFCEEYEKLKKVVEEQRINAMERDGEGFMEKLNRVSKVVKEYVKVLFENIEELKGELESLITGLSPKQVLEGERSMPESDLQKFHDMVEQYRAYQVNLKKAMEVRKKVLEAMEEERKRLYEKLKKVREKQKENAVIWRHFNLA